MTIEEQNTFQSKEYAEAIRYMDNAKDTLRKAEKQDDGYYVDAKYVRSACGIAYLGVLLAVDAWLALKGVSLSGKKKSIDLYEQTVAQMDKKMLVRLKSAYSALHLSGYYHGDTRVSIVRSGFDAAYEIIEKIKPENPIDVAETKGDKAKRIWSRMMISLAVMFMGNRV
jgi:hypothetical protein